MKRPLQSSETLAQRVAHCQKLILMILGAAKRLFLPFQSFYQSILLRQRKESLARKEFSTMASDFNLIHSRQRVYMYDGAAP